MDSIVVACDKCGARLKVPGTLPAGKKVKCPKCGELLAVPSAAPSDAGYAIAHAPAPRAVALAPAKKRCQYCGEQILADAVKCRHCGEFLDPAAARAGKRSRSASDGDLTAAEYIVATLFCPFGLAVGIF